jgi:hypothetical protein
LEKFITHFTGWKHETYEKIEYIILPFVGAFFFASHKSTGHFGSGWFWVGMEYNYCGIL